MNRYFQSALPPPAPTTNSLIGPFVGFSNGAGLPGAGSAGMVWQNGLAASSLPQTGLGANTNITPVGIGDSVTFSNTADPTRSVDGAGDVEQVTYALVNESDLQPASAANASTFNSAPTGNALGPSLARVGIASSADNGVLVRRVTRHLLAPQTEAPVDQVICRHVSAFKIVFYDGTQWVGGWNLGQSEQYAAHGGAGDAAASRGRGGSEGANFAVYVGARVCAAVLGGSGHGGRGGTQPMMNRNRFNFLGRGWSAKSWSSSRESTLSAQARIPNS